MIGRILPFTAILVPFWLVRAMVSWSETFEVLPAILVVGLSFAGMQFFWSNYMDSNLVDIAAGVTSMVATVIFLRFWKPKRIWRFADEREADLALKNAAAPASPAKPIIADQMDDEWDVRKLQQTAPITSHTGGQIAKAWLPFAILSIFVLVWGFPTSRKRWGVPPLPASKPAAGKCPISTKRFSARNPWSPSPPRKTPSLISTG